jgi:hypothetical protein
MTDITVDLWQDFDFTTLDETNLAAHDHASVGTWTIDDPESNFSTSTSGEKLSDGTFSGNDDSGGTHGLAMTAPNPADNTVIIYEFSADKSSCSYGFWYKFPAGFIGSDDEHDILYVENNFGSNELYVKQTDHSGRGGHLYLYTGESGYSTAIQIGSMDDEWIWITAQHNTGGAGSPHRLRAYTADGTQIGSEQTLASHATEPSFQASLGSGVGALQGYTGTHYFDDWIMDWTDATFPLGPPEGAPPGPGPVGENLKMVLWGGFAPYS